MFADKTFFFIFIDVADKQYPYWMKREVIDYSYNGTFTSKRAK